MNIGKRKVRSAGRTSGSIEITLPPELAALEGVSCHIFVRDGARPEIVLQPDLTPAVVILARLWIQLRSLLRLAGDIGDFPAQEIEATLFPAKPTNGRPLLVYMHALRVGQGLVSDWPVHHLNFDLCTSDQTLTAEVAEALAGVVAPLATLAGRHLGLSGQVAVEFGKMMAGLATAQTKLGDDSGRDYEQVTAWQYWATAHGTNGQPLSLLAPNTNDPQARVALKQIVSQFREWQERPERHQAERVGWQQSIPDWIANANLSTLEHFAHLDSKPRHTRP